MPRNIHRLLSFFVIFSSLFLIQSCEKNTKTIKPLSKKIDQLIGKVNRLEIRISNLEKSVSSKDMLSKEKNIVNNKSSSSMVQSITLRIGSEDDRLRIYWTNGTNSDLPCTKEQSIWVCG